MILLEKPKTSERKIDKKRMLSENPKIAGSI